MYTRMESWGDAASVSQTLIQHYPSVSRVPGSLQDKKGGSVFCGINSSVPSGRLEKHKFIQLG